MLLDANDKQGKPVLHGASRVSEASRCGGTDGLSGVRRSMIYVSDVQKAAAAFAQDMKENSMEDGFGGSSPRRVGPTLCTHTSRPPQARTGTSADAVMQGEGRTPCTHISWEPQARTGTSAGCAMQHDGTLTRNSSRVCVTVMPCAAHRTSCLGYWAEPRRSMSHPIHASCSMSVKWELLLSQGGKALPAGAKPGSKLSLHGRPQQQPKSPGPGRIDLGKAGSIACLEELEEAGKKKQMAEWSSDRYAARQALLSTHCKTLPILEPFVRADFFERHMCSATSCSMCGKVPELMCGPVCAQLDHAVCRAAAAGNAGAAAQPHRHDIPPLPLHLGWRPCWCAQPSL